MKFAIVILGFLVAANAYPTKPLVQIFVNVDSASDVSSPIFVQPPTGTLPEGIPAIPAPENVGEIGIMPIPEFVDPGYFPIVPLPEIIHPEIIPIRPLPEIIPGKPMPANFAELFQQLKEQYGKPAVNAKPVPANFGELFQQLKEQYGKHAAVKPTPAIV